MNNFVNNICNIYTLQPLIYHNLHNLAIVSILLKEITIIENDVFTVTAGNTLTTFDMDGVKIGLGICCDLFYPEMATLYRKFGKKIS